MGVITESFQLGPKSTVAIEVCTSVLHSIKTTARSDDDDDGSGELYFGLGSASLSYEMANIQLMKLLGTKVIFSLSSL